MDSPAMRTEARNSEGLRMGPEERTDSVILQWSSSRMQRPVGVTKANRRLAFSTAIKTEGISK